MIYNAQEYARLRNSVLAISLAAWLVLLWPVPDLFAPGAASAPGALTVSYCGAPGVVLPAHSGPVAPEWPLLLRSIPAASLARDWVLMMLAMMAPMLGPPIYHLRISSFARRRARATALFVAGYGGGWLAAGFVLLALELTSKWLAPHSYLPAAFVGLVAVAWQASPFKQRCLNRCHRHPPLAAFGAAANSDALRMGLEHGRWCIGSCWAAMLCAMLLPHGHLPAMMAVGVLMYCERLDPPRMASWRWRGFETAFRYLSFRLRGPRRSPAPMLARASFS